MKGLPFIAIYSYLAHIIEGINTRLTIEVNSLRWNIAQNTLKREVK